MDKDDDLLDYNEVDPDNLIAGKPTMPLTKAMGIHPRSLTGLLMMNRKNSIEPNTVTRYSMSPLLQDHPVGRLRTYNIGSE